MYIGHGCRWPGEARGLVVVIFTKRGVVGFPVSFSVDLALDPNFDSEFVPVVALSGGFGGSHTT